MARREGRGARSGIFDELLSRVARMRASRRLFESGFQAPVAARLFILARWAKARWPAATFCGLAVPSLQRRRLQRAAVGEGELPRQTAGRVHDRQMRGRLLVGLAARQEGDARHRRRHASPSARAASFRQPPRATPCAQFLPSITMLGFSTMPSRRDARIVELGEDRLQHPFGDIVAAVDRVVARLPSISTSGSTIGTMPASWQSAA